MATPKRVMLLDPETDVRYTFRLNPENLTVERRPRINVVHTASSIYVDLFGTAAGHLTMSGSTGGGYGPEWEALKAFVAGWQNRTNAGASQGKKPSLIAFYNFTDGEYFFVALMALRGRRSVSAPLLYRYEMEMVIIQEGYLRREDAVALGLIAAAPEGHK